MYTLKGNFEGTTIDNMQQQQIFAAEAEFILKITFTGEIFN